MSAFLDSFVLSEVFVSSLVIFLVYFLFFLKKDLIRKNGGVFGFFVIVLIFLQHIVFEVLKYFFNFELLILYRFGLNVLMVPLFYYFLFYVRRKDIDINIWKWVFMFYTISVFFVGMTWLFSYNVFFVFASLFKIFTSVSLFLLIYDFIVGLN